ncbi:thioredoxin family protein [Luminiphilus sp.]|nr:thioredoxin family protein [Luminiphilus sp.]
MAKLSQMFMVVVLFCSKALLADESIQNSGVISKQALFLQHPNFQENFDRYQVLDAAPKIPDDVSVLIFLGTWCHDSQREVPRMLKILETVGFPQADIKMVTLDFSKNDRLGLAAANEVKFTPTFIFFRQQNEIGRIVEKPATTLENAVSQLLDQHSANQGSMLKEL